MGALPESSGQLRLSDAERQQAVAVLAEHYAQGRLDHDEFDERNDAVWSAKTHGDLSPVFADLPGAAAPTTPPASGSSSGSRPWRRGPFVGPQRLLLPVFMVLALVTAITHLPLVLLALGAWFLIFRGASRRWAHSSGNRFEARGSCS